MTMPCSLSISSCGSEEGLRPVQVWQPGGRKRGDGGGARLSLALDLVSLSSASPLLGLTRTNPIPSPNPQERGRLDSSGHSAPWGTVGSRPLPGFTVLVTVALTGLQMMELGGGQPRDPWSRLQVTGCPPLSWWLWSAGWAPGGEGASAGAEETHIAQVQELSLVGQAEEGGADDQVDLGEGMLLSAWPGRRDPPAPRAPCTCRVGSKVAK